MSTIVRVCRSWCQAQPRSGRRNLAQSGTSPRVRSQSGTPAIRDTHPVRLADVDGVGRTRNPGHPPSPLGSRRWRRAYPVRVSSAIASSPRMRTSMPSATSVGSSWRPGAANMAQSSTDRVGLAARLLVARRWSGLSRLEVARRLSVTVAAVGHWENPKGAKPGIGRLNRIAEVLSVDVGWLLSESPLPEPTRGASAAVDRRVGRQRHGCDDSPAESRPRP